MTDADAPAEPTALVVDVRPPLAGIWRRLVATLASVGAVVGVAYFLAAPSGREVLEARGPLAAAGGWAIFLALLIGGALLGLSISRGVSAGQRPLRRGQVIRHIVGESIAAGCGAVVAAVIAAFGFPDVMQVLLAALVLTALFTWSVLMPASLARFDAHAA